MHDWNLVMHVFIKNVIIDSDNGLLFVWHQAIVWTIVELLSAATCFFYKVLIEKLIVCAQENDVANVAYKMKQFILDRNMSNISQQ